ncbi:MAG: Endoribonuclease YbeY [Planctomycetota bacterium]|jgi:probable rRNA maturation factor
MLDIEIDDQQFALKIDHKRLARVLDKIATDHGFSSGEVSVILVDDETIHRVNRDHLQHDYPTDVISFVFEATGSHLEGEILVSTDTAIRESTEGGWDAGEETLLYCIHGMLHLVGMDDIEDVDRQAMRAQEAKYLGVCGLATETIRRMAADADEAQS